ALPPLIARLALEAPRVHLFADCGMSRDGCPPAEWAALCGRAADAARAGLIECVGVMGHLGCGDHVDASCHRDGVATYERALRTAARHGIRPRLRHLAATSAALRAPLTHHTLLRTGAGLVGIDPGRSGLLRHSATLEAPVVQVRRVPAGATIGYGHDHAAPRTTWLGLVPLGYADGIPRSASSRAEVLVAGVRRPLVGLVSMDQCVVDLGPSAPAPGTVVTVFGGAKGAPRLTDWAVWAGVLEHEVLTGIGRRVERVAATHVLHAGCAA
ncbi:MAG: alanine racemase, partial [Nocardioides sp.]|uniref:alanine racemase n=1 Tax=Nocardioides sp. TaxID=35761 RepID=UPI003EFE02EB